MPITRPCAPLSATAALIEGLPAFLSGPNPDPARKIVKQAIVGSSFQIPTADDLNFKVGEVPTAIPDYNPIHVFVLKVGDITKGLGAGAAISSGWRFFVGDPGGRVVMAWVARRPPSGMWKLAATFYGPGVAAALNASQALLPPDSGAYELRMITVPSLSLEAFHLKAQTAGSEDLFVPFPNATAQHLPDLRAAPLFKETAFLTAILKDLPSRKAPVPRSGG